MNRWAAPLGAALAGAFCLVATVASADPVSSLEQWAGAGTAGWTNLSAQVSVSNPGGYLAITFGAQSIPELVEDRAWVDLPSGLLVTNIAFRFLAASVEPSALRVVLEATTNGHVWQCNLEPPATGSWGDYAVPVSEVSAWSMGPAGTPADFEQDLTRFDRVAVYVRRHGSPAVQEYGVDDFTLQGLALTPDMDRDGDGIPDGWEFAFSLNPGDPSDAAGDADGDGMSNFAEYRAGTNPRDGDSRFEVSIRTPPAPTGARVEGMVLRWNSISNRTYAIWRNLDLRVPGFDRVESGVAATPPVNEYTAPLGSNQAAGFFRIEVESTP